MFLRSIPLSRRAALALALGASAAGFGGAQGAAAQAPPASPSVDVVKVQGVIDPAEEAYVRGTIRDAERARATVVLQIDSRGSFGRRAQALAAVIRSASVPVIGWVGPSGAQAAGGSLFPLYASSLAGMAPGAGIGPGRPFDLATSTAREDADGVRRASASLEALASGAGATSSGAAMAIGAALAAGPAQSAGAVAFIAVDIPDLLQKLDGRAVATPAGPVTLATATRADRPVAVRFHEIGPVRRVLHAVSTPTAVYVLLVLGLWGVAFELTQPALGMAGIAGILALALAGYGLAVIPVHWLGIAVLLGGTALLGLDVVIRRLQWLTLAGTGLFAAGSILAWRGVGAAIDVPLWLVGMFTAGAVLFFGFGLTVALRSREPIRTAQVGLVGLVGETRSDLDPEGGVVVKGAVWRARTMDGPIVSGARVRVRGVDGLVLRVEPEPDPGPGDGDGQA